MKKIILFLALFLVIFFPHSVSAQGQVLGIHLLSPHEIKEVKNFFYEPSDDWSYVTIPLSLADLDKKTEWAEFFRLAKEYKLIPLVRLTTSFEAGAWKVPNRKEITSYFDFLNQFTWPSEERYVIVFNEVNHAKEWGNSIDPIQYAQVLAFTSDWAHSENKNYKILPAAMDLAAPNGYDTMEAFNYLDKMYKYDPDIFQKIDYWNSHSYPNPGFSSSPTRIGKNSLRGFHYELNYLKNKTGLELEVFITETGWVSNKYNNRWLSNYYTYALQHIWSDERVKGVTVFVLRGDPGPFAEFGFLDSNNQPTNQYFAVKKAIKNVQKEL
ncbi:MAG: hypothetical protein ACOZAK_01470 [Patescibacteria group bacterium]